MNRSVLDVARGSAKEFLRDVLSAGPVSATDVTEKADAKGIAERTLKRARQQLGIIASKDGFQGGGSGCGVSPAANGNRILEPNQRRPSKGGQTGTLL
jgi:hypothetical protein